MLKTLILAGGKGTRIKEYTENIPKPLIEANGIPLFIHIIKIYERYGVDFFVLLGGYKQEELTRYLESNYKKISKNENLFQLETLSKVLVLDTGQESMTGGRIKVALNYFAMALYYAECDKAADRAFKLLKGRYYDEPWNMLKLGFKSQVDVRFTIDSIKSSLKYRVSHLDG